jgi:hypothetical protein
MPKKSETASPKTAKPRASRKSPPQEAIALRAYQIFLERNGAPGNPLDDWTRAERELLAQTGKLRRKPAPKSKAA